LFDLVSEGFMDYSTVNILVFGIYLIFVGAGFLFNPNSKWVFEISFRIFCLTYLCNTLGIHT